MLAWFFAGLLCGAGDGAALPVTAAPVGHWLLVVGWQGDGPVLGSQRWVAAPQKGGRGGPANLPLRLELRDAAGKILYVTTALDPRTVHLAYVDAAGDTQHVHAAAPQPAVAVRLPALSSARSLVFLRDGTVLGSLALRLDKAEQ